MKRQIFKARTYKDREKMIEFLIALPESEMVKGEFSSIRDLRTVDQNKLYWLWLACLEKETGTNSNFYHEYFKEKYLPKDTAIVFGRVINVVASTTSKDTKLFGDYLKNVRIESEVELGIVLPDPKDKAWEKFYLQYRDFI